MTLPTTAGSTLAAPVAAVAPVRLAKGHGTENDFVLLADPDGVHELTATAVARLCDRRAGLGGDGLIRAVPTCAVPEVAHLAEAAAWFMDYRNADGSLAEMCGNGVRVFVAFLLREGLVTLLQGEVLAVATRAGVKLVRRVMAARDEATAVQAPGGDVFAVGMGPWSLVGGASALARGHDALVHLAGLGVALPGLRVDLGNPHVVVALPVDVDLDAIDLSTAPVVEPPLAGGINVELISVESVDATGGHLSMRVHERGVGETRSCGTGAVATVVAARAWAGPAAPRRWTVDVPGGRLTVSLPEAGPQPGAIRSGAAVEAAASSLLAGPDVELAGPAVVLADLVVDPRWWSDVVGG